MIKFGNSPIYPAPLNSLDSQVCVFLRERAFTHLMPIYGHYMRNPWRPLSPSHHYYQIPDATRFLMEILIMLEVCAQEGASFWISSGYLARCSDLFQTYLDLSTQGLKLKKALQLLLEELSWHSSQKQADKALTDVIHLQAAAEVLYECEKSVLVYILDVPWEQDEIPSL
jgi:hypothetical protein